MRAGFLALAVFSLVALAEGQEQKGKEKAQDLGIEIENVEPEKTFTSEELLIKNIETKTEGEVVPAKEASKPLVPEAQEEEEEETGAQGKWSGKEGRRDFRINRKFPVGRKSQTGSGGGSPVLKEEEVLRELRKQRSKQVRKAFRNPRVLQQIQSLFGAQKIRTSEAREWLKEKKEKKKKETAPGIYEFSPQAGMTKMVQAQEEKKEKKAGGEQKGKGRTIFGYCVVDRDIRVGALEMKARFPCVFSDEKISTGFVWGTLQPKPRAYTLLFKPERIETLMGAYRVVEGVALNGSRSSNNVASTVNTRVIEKIFAKAGVDTAKESKKMVEEAWKNGGTTVFTTGTVTVQKKEFNLNLLPYYAIWTAGLSFAEGVMDLLQKETKDIPVLFTIHRGARLYVEVVIDETPYIR